MTPDNLKLFDDLERSDFGSAKYSESHWSYLNRTARPEYQYIRDLLQRWFDDYEADSVKRQQLCGLFRSEKDDTHFSAFFELYIYQLFKSQGFDIEVEPNWGQKRPDFLLTRPDGTKILLEATANYPKRSFEATKKHKEKMFDYLNENLKSPDFFLDVKTRNSSNQSPKYSDVKDRLEEWLESLDYDQIVDEALGREEIGLRRYPSITWEGNSWHIKFTAIPKSNDLRGVPDVQLVGSTSGPVQEIDTISHPKKKLKRKYKHYGELDVPYILALNVHDPFFDDESLDVALFGQKVTGENAIKRDPKRGYAWYSQSGYQKKRMSAICVFKRLRPDTMHTVSPVVWHHPLANNPLERDLLRLTQRYSNHVGDFELIEGKHPCDLLRLDKTKMPG